MSDDHEDRTFERWALVGCCLLALLGLAAFLTRHRPPEPLVRRDDGDVLRVTLGGPRPPASATGRGSPEGPPPREAPREAVDVPVPPPETRSAPPPEPRSVVVQPGETLGQIAQRELGSARRAGEIAALNGLTSPDEIRAGTTLLLPPR